MFESPYYLWTLLATITCLAIWSKIRVSDTRPKLLKAITKKLTKVEPNLIITIVSITLGAMLLCISYVLFTGFTYDVLLNLGTSIITIGITVVIVDVYRRSREEMEYRVPKRIAADRIKSIHFSILLNLTIKNFSRESEVVKSLIASDEDKITSMTDILVNNVDKLILVDQRNLLQAYSRFELTGFLTDTIVDLRKEMEIVESRYRFAFRSVRFNTELAQLIQYLGKIEKSFDLYSMDNDQVKEVLDDAAIAHILSASIHGYLVELQEFLLLVNKYAEK